MRAIRNICVRLQPRFVMRLVAYKNPEKVLIEAELQWGACEKLTGGRPTEYRKKDSPATSPGYLILRTAIALNCDLLLQDQLGLVSPPPGVPACGLPSAS